ncbi:MAG: peptidylprolyl isomerase [Trueperaceae bacterium]|nr:peptidylprolyl isomerase [Trueperaceae bacterium]
MQRTRPFRPLAALLALLILALPTLAAAEDDPVLVELGATRERSGVVLQRFDIAVRGLIASQGGVYSLETMEQLYPFLPQFLEQRAGELVLVDAARARGLTVDEDVIDGFLGQARTQFPDEAAFDAVLADAGFRDVEQLLAVLREEQLVQLLFAELEAEVVLSELEVRVAYEALKPQLMQPEQVCGRHILLDDEAGAAALSRAARAGADFAAMATTASTDRGSAARGGDLGCFGQGMMVPEFEAAAFAAEPGVATEPVQSAFGWHVILVERRVPAQALALDEVRVQLERQLRGERVDATIQAYIASSGVRTYPERIPAFADAYGSNE